MASSEATMQVMRALHLAITITALVATHARLVRRAHLH